MNLKGKKALITGSTQGIGLSLAKALKECGAEVFINGREEEKVKKLCLETGARPAVCDISDPRCDEILFNITGEVDILILSASVQVRSAWDKIEDEDAEIQINTNFKSSVRLIRRYAPFMKEKGFGRIITIGSVQESVPHPDMLIYSAMKSAGVNMVKNLARQLAPFGVTVNNVAPGVIATPRNEEALSDEKYKSAVISKIPSGFIGKPSECDGLVLLLSSDEGRYITGQSIFVDGGMSI